MFIHVCVCLCAWEGTGGYSYTFIKMHRKNKSSHINGYLCSVAATGKRKEDRNSISENIFLCF